MRSSVFGSYSAPPSGDPGPLCQNLPDLRAHSHLEIPAPRGALHEVGSCADVMDDGPLEPRDDLHLPTLIPSRRLKTMAWWVASLDVAEGVGSSEAERRAD